MALLTSEMQRIRYELGYNVLAAGAEPYISYHAIFDIVVAAYLNAGATTTSATAVTAATTATPVALTLASGTGFAAGARVYIDVDDRQEVATVQSIASPIITVQLKGTHSGTYPVTVDGGEGIVREALRRIRGVKDSMGNSLGEGALKKVDEIEFYNSRLTTFGALGQQLRHYRNELASALGVTNLWELKSSASQSFALV